MATQHRTEGTALPSSPVIPILWILGNADPMPQLTQRTRQMMATYGTSIYLYQDFQYLAALEKKKKKKKTKIGGDNA